MAEDVDAIADQLHLRQQVRVEQHRDAATAQLFEQARERSGARSGRGRWSARPAAAAAASPRAPGRSRGAAASPSTSPRPACRRRPKADQLEQSARSAAPPAEPAERWWSCRTSSADDQPGKRKARPGNRARPGPAGEPGRLPCTSRAARRSGEPVRRRSWSAWTCRRRSGRAGRRSPPPRPPGRPLPARAWPRSVFSRPACECGRRCGQSRFRARCCPTLHRDRQAGASWPSVLRRSSRWSSGSRSARAAARSSRQASTGAAEAPGAGPRSERKACRCSARSARLLMISFHGTTAPEYVCRALRQGRAAGVILFRANVPSPRGQGAHARSCCVPVANGC